MNKRAQILLEESQGMHGLGQPDYGSAGETYLPSEPAAPPVVRYPVSVPIYKRGKIVGAAPYYPPSGATARVTAKPVTRVVQARALPYADAIASAQQDYTKTLQALKRVMQRVSVEEQQAGVAPGSWVETDPGVIAAMQKWQETQNGLANLRMWQQERISQEQQVPRVSPAPGLEVSVMEKPVLEHVDEALSFDFGPRAMRASETEFASREAQEVAADIGREERSVEDFQILTAYAAAEKPLPEPERYRQQEKLEAALTQASGEAATEAFAVPKERERPLTLPEDVFGFETMWQAEKERAQAIREVRKKYPLYAAVAPLVREKFIEGPKRAVQETVQSSVAQALDSALDFFGQVKVESSMPSLIERGQKIYETVRETAAGVVQEAKEAAPELAGKFAASVAEVKFEKLNRLASAPLSAEKVTGWSDKVIKEFLRLQRQPTESSEAKTISNELKQRYGSQIESLLKQAMSTGYTSGLYEEAIRQERFEAALALQQTLKEMIADAKRLAHQFAAAAVVSQIGFQ